ncbi:MAG TPA: hypothetical protein VGN00_09355 [Puia sp.]|jgi:hypothetical protein
MDDLFRNERDLLERENWDAVELVNQDPGDEEKEEGDNAADEI